MPQIARHASLKCKLNGLPKTWASTHLTRFHGLGKYPIGWDLRGARDGDIHNVLCMVSMRQLSYPIPVDIAEFLNAGVDVFVNYFSEDWWKGDKFATKTMDKTKHKSTLKWFGPFSNGLLLGLLSERWSDLEKACNWIETSLPADYHGCDAGFDPVLFDIYKRMASELRTKPLARLPSMAKLRTKCESKRGELLLAAWEAILTKNQKEFDERICWSVDAFLRKGIGGPIAVKWIATHESC